jgi:hypothetical protein
LSYLAPDIVRALFKGRPPLTPARLLRLSKDLPHDWNEYGQFLGFAGTIHKFRPERSITPASKTASRDPATVRAPHPGVSRLWFSELQLRLKPTGGIWTCWTSVRNVKEGETTNDIFAFLTTEPNKEVAAIHPKAMPALKLQRPLSDNSLRIVARGIWNVLVLTGPAHRVC